MQRTRIFTARALEKSDLIYMSRSEFMRMCDIKDIRTMIDRVSEYNNQEKEGKQLLIEMRQCKHLKDQFLDGSLRNLTSNNQRSSHAQFSWMGDEYNIKMQKKDETIYKFIDKISSRKEALAKDE